MRAVCAIYSVEDIYNCDETGIYLKELATKSCTVPEGKSGVKANRRCPKNIAREVEDVAKDRMTIEKNGSGWLKRNILMHWLIALDQQIQ
ncbi:hypothetical protein BGZ95_005151 [Linnemannia exigua]|uniref:Uncharacterized protein n=1 Tax=Linnemannia exigua TaxID=604196 RepID=A0AAD4D278_9FUNG|nr:hypothetical protein BGZ95_005151 [Linnemannia exigua]